MEVYNGGIFSRLFHDNLATGKREGLANAISHQVQCSVWKRCRFQLTAGGAGWPRNLLQRFPTAQQGMITAPLCFVFAQKEECCEIIISWDDLAISLLNASLRTLNCRRGWTE